MAEKKDVEKEEARPAKNGRKWPVAVGAAALAILFFALGWGTFWLAIGGNARGLLWAVDTAKKHFYRDISEDEIYEGLYGGLTDALDRYSQFFDADEYGAELDRTAGKSAGYGITVTTQGSDLRLYAVAGNSPAEHAGLGQGMYLFSFGESEKMLKKGTQQELSAFLDETDGPALLRCGYEEDGSDAKIYSVMPASYRTSYCLYRDMGGSYRFDPTDLGTKFEVGEPLETVDEKTAYIRLERFYGTAAEEFEACLSLMKEEKRSRLILDLRGNGGGYLSVLCDLVSHLMKNAQGARPTVLTARYRDGSESAYLAAGNDFSSYFGEDFELYLLADERTASASESLIGALISYGTLDFGNILLRGSSESARTFGKGIMQSTYTDLAGNAMKLTVAEIFWPNGRSIHATGVTAADGAVCIEADSLFSVKDDAMLSALCTRLSGLSEAGK